MTVTYLSRFKVRSGVNDDLDSLEAWGERVLRNIRAGALASRLDGYYNDMLNADQAIDAAIGRECEATRRLISGALPSEL